jgi:hypothetical protein
MPQAEAKQDEPIPPLPLPPDQWVPILAQHGPYELHLPDFAGSATQIGCDASVASIDSHRRIGVWATVSGNGQARCGWYEADGPTSSAAAELEAIRWALLLHPASDDHEPLTLVNDHTGAAEVAQRLAAGEWPVGPTATPCRCIHQELLEAARDEMPRHNFTVQTITGRSGVLAPVHPLLRATHKIAWTLQRLLVDGIPVDDRALRLVQRLGNSPARGRRFDLAKYRWWMNRYHPRLLGPDRAPE